LVSPTNGSTLLEPVLEWKAVAGAAYYKVELSTSSTFYTLDHTYTTYNTRITPSSAIEHATFYWRVSAVDAGDHVGTPSASWSFIKGLPAPTLLSPTNLSSLIEPVLEWQAVAGAAYYKVELSIVSNFVPVAHVYNTYDTRVAPSSAIENTTFYWRVSAVDAGDHVGTPSSGWSFIKNIPAPTLLSPANLSTLIEPVLEWQSVEGAAYYKVELSTVSNFVPVAHVYNIYNTRLTSANAIDHTTFFWRVSGVDAGDHVGTVSEARTFTLNSPPAPIEITPELLVPLDTATITTDPNFSWTPVVGAAYYRLKVSKDPSLSPLYDWVNADYGSFTPYVGTPTAGVQDVYPNGTYYWQVEARNGSGLVIATSLARSFTKHMSLPLVGPADGATLTTDPTFQWTRVVGAAYYRLKVSKDPSLSPLYDWVNADYVSFTPYVGTPTAGVQDVYSNGAYYWEVEAHDHGGIVIATSSARHFTKQMTLALIAPVDGTRLAMDPTFQWTRVVGAAYYRLKVSKNPSLSPLYDYVNADYVSFTPYVGTPTAGIQAFYPNGTYYWEVEARDHGGILIATSNSWMFTKGSFLFLPLIIK
jgi:hypothetical protein